MFDNADCTERGIKSTKEHRFLYLYHDFVHIRQEKLLQGGLTMAGVKLSRSEEQIRGTLPV